MERQISDAGAEKKVGNSQFTILNLQLAMNEYPINMEN